MEVGKRINRHPGRPFWAMAPLPPFLLPGSLGRPLGRPLEETSLYPFHLVINTPSLSLLLLPTIHLVEPRLGGKVGTTAGHCLDLPPPPPPPPPRLGSSISGVSGVKAGAIYLRIQGAQGREAARFLAPQRLLVHPVIPPLPFTLSCISNCISLALRRWLLCERLQGMATATATATGSVPGTLDTGQGRARD